MSLSQTMPDDDSANGYLLRQMHSLGFDEQRLTCCSSVAYVLYVRWFSNLFVLVMSGDVMLLQTNIFGVPLWARAHHQALLSG